MREASTRKVMGGWPLLAASMARSCSGQAAAICSTSQAGCAVRAGSCASTRASSDTRSATKRLSTALVSPVARSAPSSRAPSTAACTVSSATLREYSIWWAATVSSARSGLARRDGWVRRASTAGARRRYQRRVPSAMARTAARSEAFASGASAEWPFEITSSTARAAAASAGAPGAQGVLDKLPPGQSHAMRVVAYGDPPAPRPLHLRDAQAASTASNEHEVVLYGDDHTGIRAFNVLCRIFIAPGCRGFCLRRQEAQRFPLERRFRHGPGIEGADLALDLHRVAAPVDACLGLLDPGRVRDPLGGLGAGRQCAGSESLDRLQERRGAELRERIVERAAGVARGNGEPALQQHRARVQTRVHLHDGDAGLGLPGEEGSLDGCGSAPARQERGVDVDAPQGRQSEDLAWQDQSIGRDDQNLRLPGEKRCARGGARESVRLRERHARGKRRGLYRAGGEFAAAAPGQVRLRQDPDEAVAGEQRREGGQREFWRAGKGDAQRQYARRALPELAAAPCGRRPLRSFSSFLRIRSRFRSDR